MVGKKLTVPKRHDDSLTAPQHPRKPTIVITPPRIRSTMNGVT